jgi:hypothetical protein
MKKVTYQIEINSPANKVFKTMLGLDEKSTYEAWTSVFNPTSTYEGHWVQDAKMHFVGCDENGKKHGLISKIEKFQENQFVSIRHYGMIVGDEEITSGPEVESWSGCHENYYFSEINGITTLKVDMDVVEEHLDYFNKTYPLSLQKLKEIIEN